MRTACAVSVALLLLLAACGSEDLSGIVLEAPRSDPAVSIVVLDPAGRLLDVGRPPDLFLVDGDDVSRVPTWSDDLVHTLDTVPSAGTELLVVAHGCRPMRTTLAPGRNVVRLEAGFRVHVSIRGELPIVPEGAAFGVRLSTHVGEIEGITLPGNLVIQPVSADVFDADTPPHPQHMRVPIGGVFDVFVPIPGRYALHWCLGLGNSSASSVDSRRPLILEPGTDTLQIVWAKETIERSVKRMQGER